MKILMNVIGSLGDLHPYLALGKGLKQRGHEVTILANPHHQRVIEDEEFIFSEIGTREDYNHFINNLDYSDRMKMTKLTFNSLMLDPMKPVYEFIRDHHVAGETLVIASQAAFGPRLAQERLGIPTITMTLTPTLFFSADAPPRLGPNENPRWMPKWGYKGMFWVADQFTDRLLSGPVNAYRKEIGLPPIKKILKWLPSSEKIVGLFPSWFAPIQPDWPSNVSLTGFCLFDGDTQAAMPPELEDFLDAGDAPIVFTPGSPNTFAKSFFEEAVQACKDLGTRGVLLSKFADQIPTDLPDTIRYVPYAPFPALLPRSTAVVHHGGAGSCAQAMRVGIPQLVVPWAFDQYDNADRVTKLGVGEELNFAGCKSGDMVKALDRIIHSPDTRGKCETLAQRIRETNAVALTCEQIEAFGEAEGLR